MNESLKPIIADRVQIPPANAISHPLLPLIQKTKVKKRKMGRRRLRPDDKDPRGPGGHFTPSTRSRKDLPYGALRRKTWSSSLTHSSFLDQLFSPSPSEEKDGTLARIGS
ncbi:hypothetical protein IHE45_05G074000 [Dioscorea alata]|uniref:Uncharacterized protein n=1 Tax=Dioscorea alata TaxID=55571 RepID=A0ACB7W2Q9_DIOAL|nr:hypothetical protein IHE45_05G074000 [Dioscorea alata]